MSVLIFVEHANGKPIKASLSAINFGRSVANTLNQPFNLLVAGSGVGAVASQLTGYGASAVYVADNPGLASILAEPYIETVTSAAKAVGATFVVGVASSVGKSIMPAIANRLGAGMASDVVAWNPADLTFDHPYYAGKIIATLKINTAAKVVTIRGASFEPAAPTGGASEVKALAVDLAGAAGKSQFVALHASTSSRPDLGEASIIVSGGRGFKDIKSFEDYLYPLADALGAAVGTTRSVVDAGVLPNDLQVGQTGKIVAPSLYFAVGISGAIQHLAGMKDSKVIVAVNKDEEAPIFNVADYGLVADLYKVMPELTEKLKAAK